MQLDSPVNMEHVENDYGGDFLVLSDVHEVEGFAGKPYECEV